MTQYDNTNRGTIGRNKRKEKSSHPDLSGKINIEGVEYWLSGWAKEANGEPFWSLSAKRRDDRPVAPANDLRVADSHDDAIPF